MRKIALILVLFAAGLGPLAWKVFRPVDAVPTPIRFEPTNLALSKSDTGWEQTWPSGRMQIYGQVQPDDRAKRFRFEFEIHNSSDEPIALGPEARFVTSGLVVTGEILRLFEPQALTIEPSGYGEFLVLFELENPVGMFAGQDIAIDFEIEIAKGSRKKFQAHFQAGQHR